MKISFFKSLFLIYSQLSNYKIIHLKLIYNEFLKKTKNAEIKQYKLTLKLY